MIRALALVLLTAVVTGCGSGFFWQQQGRSQTDFERESADCTGNAQKAPKDSDMEKVYRACMRAKGWQRVQAATPAPGQFRGPESDEEMASLPSATSAPNEDAVAVRCRANTNWNQPRLTALTEYHQCLKAR
jgi:hypothetical protein